MINSIRAVYCLLVLSATTHLQAEVFCVSNDAELVNVLDLADSNNQNDIIRISEGTYTPSWGGYTYFGATEIHGVEISGGWITYADIPCGLQLDNAVFGTTIDAASFGRAFDIRSAGSVTIKNLNIINGFLVKDDWPKHEGAGLRIDIVSTSSTGSFGGVIGGPTVVKIEKNSFINNHADGAGAVYVSGVGRVYFQNNLVIANESDRGSIVADFRVKENYIINNTFFGNTGGLYTSTATDEQAYIANNLFWENRHVDLWLNGNADAVYLYNNNYTFLIGSTPTHQSDNMTVAPVFEGGLLNFTPAWGSAMVDAGRNSPVILPDPITFPFNWSTGYFDLEGKQRTINTRVDIGALEASLPIDLIFIDGFE